MGILFTAGNRLTASLLNQYYGFADTTTTTVTAATQTELTTLYTVPANEPSIGSAYQITFGGNGTWGSTAQTLAFTVFMGTQAIVSNVTISNLAFSVNAAFRFDGRGVLVCNASGSSGTFLGGLNVTLTQIANNALPGTAADNTVSIADANFVGVTVNTTIAMPAYVTCAWGSTTGAPTISNRHTLFQKVA